MKKLSAILLAVAMMLSAVMLTVSAAKDKDGNWVPNNAKWDSISREGVVARFAIGADPHFTGYNSTAKNTNAYSAFKQIGGVDAYLIAGDLTHNGNVDEYTELMRVINAYTKKNDVNPNATGDSVGTTILSMGNHEFWSGTRERFTEKTGQQPDALYWINGIPIIAISPSENIPERGGDTMEPGNNYDLSADFLKKAYAEIDQKGYKGLIIMIAHHRTDTTGKENNYWSEEMISMMKAHPNTMVFTGHSHTWIETTKEFILQDAGFTHVRAGSLGNDYGGLGKGAINPDTGKPETPLKIEGDSNCSCVLVDIMEDGTAKLRRLDLAKGEYMFGDESFVVRPNVLTDFLHESDNADFSKSYGSGNIAPSWPDGMKVNVEDMGNNGSIIVRFPSAIAATELAKDFVAEYRIRVKAQALDENDQPVVDDAGKPVYTYVQSEGKNYFRISNYRDIADEGQDWKVYIHGLTWDTDYIVEVRAYNSYGGATPWVQMDGTINIGTGTPAYPAVPVIDFDYSYGNVKDGAGHALTCEPTMVKPVDIGGQKAVNILGLGGKPYAYEFTEEDYLAISDFFVMEAYFSATNVTNTQCIMGSWDGANLGFKIEGGKLNLWANITSMAAGQQSERNIVSAPIEANKWYHAVAVYDGISMKLYINGELVDENEKAKGGLDVVIYDADQDEDTAGADPKKVVRNFCVGAGQYDSDGAFYLMNNCMINKAALYSGVMTEEDVKNAYKIATTALPFTDVKDAWYIDSVEYAYNTGLMNGSSATTFSPSTKTSRAMIVQMLYNLEGKPAVDTKDNPFKDIPAKKWYTNAVLWAYQNGVTTGTSKTTFSPDALVTREQVAVFLYRYLKDYKKVDVGDGADLSAYPDADNISKYAGFKEAVAWANANGIIGGKKNGETVTLAPKDQAMRSEVAKMFVSFAKKY